MVSFPYPPSNSMVTLRVQAAQQLAGRYHTRVHSVPCTIPGKGPLFCLGFQVSWSGAFSTISFLHFTFGLLSISSTLWGRLVQLPNRVENSGFSLLASLYAKS